MENRHGVWMITAGGWSAFLDFCRWKERSFIACVSISMITNKHPIKRIVSMRHYGPQTFSELFAITPIHVILGLIKHVPKIVEQFNRLLHFTTRDRATHDHSTRMLKPYVGLHPVAWQELDMRFVNNEFDWMNIMTTIYSIKINTSKAINNESQEIKISVGGAWGTRGHRHWVAFPTYNPPTGFEPNLTLHSSVITQFLYRR